MQHYLMASSMAAHRQIEYYIIVIKLPMKTLSILRDRQHQSIRRGQILSKFKARRNCLQIIEPNEAIHKIKESLQLFKAIMIDDSLHLRMQECLATIHNIVEVYYVIDIFLTDVQFDLQLESVKNGNLPVECNWVELLRIIMNQDWPNEVYEECSAILSLSAYQLRMKTCNQNQKDPEINQLVNGLLYQIPFSSLMNGSHYKITGNLLVLLQQLLTISKSAQMVQYLSQMSPNVLQLICDLFKEEKIMAIQQIKRQLIATALLFVNQSYQFRMHDQSNYQFYSFTQSLKQICFDDFLSPQNDEDFQLACRYIDVMSKSGIKFTKQQLLMVESTIFNRKGAMQSLQSLRLMNVLMSVNRYALTDTTTRTLIQNMLQSPQTSSDERLKLKSIQVLLLKRHMDNCKDDQQSQNLCSLFQTSKDGRKKYKKLVQLIHFAHNNCELTFELLIEFVYFLLRHDPPSARMLIKQQLLALNSYQQFRLMLDELGYMEGSEELQLW